VKWRSSTIKREEIAWKVFYSKIRINKLLKFISSKYNHNVENTTILDIGCGVGWSLKEAKRMGYKCSGVEPMAMAANYAKVNLHLDVINEKYNSSLIKNPVDIVILDQVAEHVSSPLEFLIDVTKVLKPAGILFIAVPPNDWLRRALSISLQIPYKILRGRLISRNSLIKKMAKLDLYSTPEGHINVFTEKSIRLLANRLGLEYCSQYHSSQKRNIINKIFSLTSGSYILRKN